MKTNVLTPILVFTCLCLYTALELKEPSKNNYTIPYAKQLEKERDSLQQKNALLDARYKTLQLKDDSLKQCIAGVKQNIYQLKNKQHENTNAIDRLNNLDLYRFFAAFKPADTTAKQ